MEQRRVDGQATGGAYCGRRLHELLPEYGFDILAHGSSDWNIAPFGASIATATRSAWRRCWR